MLIGLPVPRVVHVAHIDYCGKPYPVLVMEKVPGQSLDKIAAEVGTGAICHFHDVGVALRHLREAAHFTYHYLSSEYDGSEDDFAMYYLARLHDRCAVAYNQLRSDGDRVWIDLTSLARDIRVTDFGWTTFDWRMKHLFVQDNHLSGIIDLEFTKVFDVAVDLAILLHDIILNGPATIVQKAVAAVIQGYGGLSNYPEKFWDRVRFYMARQAIIHSTTMLGRGVDPYHLIGEADLAARYLSATFPQILDQAVAWKGGLLQWIGRH